MYHTVAYGINFIVALDATLFVIGQDVEDCLYGTFMVGQAEVNYLF